MRVLAEAEVDVADELERLRGPITAYCYRMLGSPHDADDAVQETMVRAWRSSDRLEHRAGLRSWVFKIATNVCIDAANARRRRALPMDLAAPADWRTELGAPLPETSWVQPIPSRLVKSEDPVDRAVSSETVRLAFIAALQHLLPRQRAVLILRDVLRWKAAEVAELLETSVDAVNSALRRARATMADARSGDGSVAGTDAPIDPQLLERYVDAFERFDIDRIVSLLHRDVVVAMPPYSFWLRGRDDFRRFLESGAGACGHTRLVVIEANGGSAISLYERDDEGELQPWGVHVLEWDGREIVALHAFIDPSLVGLFEAVA